MISNRRAKMHTRFLQVRYKSGYKYQVTSYPGVMTGILGYDITGKFFTLRKNGKLTALPGYAWDGATWCPDVRSILRGSLFHDIIAQMLRMELIPSMYRITGDRLLKKMCIDDGMWRWAAYIIYSAVRLAGKSSTHPNNKRQEFTAP